jgi:hypothetical protein
MYYEKKSAPTVLPTNTTEQAMINKFAALHAMKTFLAI